MTIFRNKLARLGLAAALTAGLGAAPALAAPLHAGPAGVKAAKSQDVSSVRYRGHRHHAYRHHHYRPGLAAGVAGAVVGAATAPFWLFGGPAYYDYGPRYAYNRYGYNYGGSCMIDEGYGRTIPCDAGGAP
jgi:hypothetical protein